MCNGILCLIMLQSSGDLTSTSVQHFIKMEQTKQGAWETFKPAAAGSAQKRTLPSTKLLFRKLKERHMHAGIALHL